MDIVDRLEAHAEGVAGTNCIYGTCAKAAAEITRLRKEIASDLEKARSESYEEGYSEGQSDCEAALKDFWGSMLHHLKKHDCEPASDDGFSHNAGQMMDAVFEREGNLRREIESLRKERDEARAALSPLLTAAKGLSFGTDWNKGTHAVAHGYRQSLLDAIPAAERAALPTPEATK